MGRYLPSGLQKPYVFRNEFAVLPACAMVLVGLDPGLGDVNLPRKTVRKGCPDREALLARRAIGVGGSRQIRLFERLPPNCSFRRSLRPKRSAFLIR